MGAIPSTIAKISSLEVLNLQNNSFTGPFPLGIFNIPSLTIIALPENHILGTLLMDLCTHCPKLQGLYLLVNDFSGRLPSQMNYCRELVHLALSYNKFDGSIPEGFGSLEKLEFLYLLDNHLTGTIYTSYH
jgi:LRR receptor-like serine/threonine-protein kinase FLS2